MAYTGLPKPMIIRSYYVVIKMQELYQNLVGLIYIIRGGIFMQKKLMF